MIRLVRAYSTKFSLKSGSKTISKAQECVQSIHPTTPARTRFAPSPTGYLHLGSLRTALYNYLLAKNTGGQFLLRLEDTDQNRLVEDAEQNIYDSLKWCNIEIDEGPNEGGEFGPYRQSDRTEIYNKYIQILLDKGLAYYCTCSKERLHNLRESASLLKPPTTVTYDRKCLSQANAPHAQSIIRFKSPEKYESFHDLVHGTMNLQPQVNYSDRRYDDIVLMKSDGLPTYHFANVVDDHLMKITHVIRGEEWLPSTPKHIALYRAFGWGPPKFAHIPLLTSLEDKKLSKRQGDIGILSMREKGILPESIINFVALFGWSPPRETPGVSSSESMTMDQLISSFSLDHLTKGNAKVNDSKLYHFNKFHLGEAVKSPKRLAALTEEHFPTFLQETGINDKELLRKILQYLGPSLTNLNEIESIHSYIYSPPQYSSPVPKQTELILPQLLCLPAEDFNQNVKVIMDNSDLSKKQVFQAVRFALSGGISGLSLPLLIELLGATEYKKRLQSAIDFISKSA